MHDVIVIGAGAAVRRVTWEPGAVDLATPRASFLARAAILTVPLGVLQAEPGSTGAIAFDPPLVAKRSALDLLAMGSVARVTLAFDEPLWAKRNEKLRYLSFLHTPAHAIKVWWTAHPMRTPLIVGWAGGPPARALLAEGAEALLAEALRGLGQALGAGRRTLERHLIGWWTHDWDADPFSRGAYSYPLVGGSDAGAKVAGGGAIAAGQHAAKQAIKALG